MLGRREGICLREPRRMAGWRKGLAGREREMEQGILPGEWAQRRS